MVTEFNIDKYLNDGMELLVRSILRATISNPRETAFVLRYSRATRDAEDRRSRLAAGGEHVPSFLIASIANRCNLSCTGCYARVNDARTDVSRKEPLSASRWGELFAEARELGVAAVLLAGGEPLTRRDVIEEAARVEDILFPVFTNGTLFDRDAVGFFGRHRNLVPVLSIEGDGAETDGRRSNGVYQKVMAAMDRLSGKGILFGASITVTTANLSEVTGEEFFAKLRSKGCAGAVFVEYVPLEPGTQSLALQAVQREILERRVDSLRSQFADAIFLSFPGDERSSGGCLAAGRGFFHVGFDGAAEPCPFSPHSDTSLHESSLRDALGSPLFRKLGLSGLLSADHAGGCVLAERDQDVARMAAGD